jgi:hypothetical protein
LSNGIPSRIYDLAGPIVVALIFLTLFVFSDSSFAATALPIFVGYCLVYLALTPGYPNRARAAGTGILAALIIAALGIAVATRIANFERLVGVLPLFDPYKDASRFAYGVLIGFCAAILRRLVLPRFFPNTPEEAREQRRDIARGTLIVGGLFLILTVLALVAYVVLYLLAYDVATFAG